MKRILLCLLLILSFVVHAQVQVVNHKNEVLTNVEVLKNGHLIGISNDNGKLPGLEKDSAYTLFHPNYRLQKIVFDDQKQIDLGAPIQLFESVDVKQNEGDLFQRIYDSTYHNFVKQDIAVLGELWVYQRLVTKTNEKKDTTLNIIRANVAYAKHEKRKKETWWVKGEPQRMFKRGGKLFDAAEFKKEDLNLNWALPSPDNLTLFFKYKSFFSEPGAYQQERYYSPTLSRVNLSYTSEKKYTLSHDLKYASLNYRCRQYESIQISPNRVATVFNMTMSIPKKSSYWNFVEKDGCYFPESMRFEFVQHFSRTDVNSSGQYAVVYIFKAKKAIPQKELSEDYEKENFSNNNYIQRIDPTPEILNFPYVLE
ncbi:hypothetical protein [Lishizhenia sp.]|uniref:hypothetical protein n=1 Tax=Lishizhenia sp. TaxID=2497594 RepID=UPI00299D528A|nr:hypothetical protein [Lishizhenia sp.]MDX1446632.1 hypothetical protein [Lishizhenia sp.]